MQSGRVERKATIELRGTCEMGGVVLKRTSKLINIPAAL
jgi:hypothetical protein